jgi:hypothetical protein
VSQAATTPCRMQSEYSSGNKQHVHYCRSGRFRGTCSLYHRLLLRRYTSTTTHGVTLDVYVHKWPLISVIASGQTHGTKCRYMCKFELSESHRRLETRTHKLQLSLWAVQSAPRRAADAALQFGGSHCKSNIEVSNCFSCCQY